MSTSERELAHGERRILIAMAAAAEVSSEAEDSDIMNQLSGNTDTDIDAIYIMIYTNDVRRIR